MLTSVSPIVPCGVAKEDLYDKNIRQKAEISGKTCFEVAHKLPPNSRRKGNTVLMRIKVDGLETKHDFVCANQMTVSPNMVTLNEPQTLDMYVSAAILNYNRKEEAACKKLNQDTLLWLACNRLHKWFSLQPAIQWNEEAPHCAIEDEEVFAPVEPVRASK